MTDYVAFRVTSVEQLFQFPSFRLKSWKGDYLHRPDSPQGVTTWNTGIGNEWVIEAPVLQPVAGDLFDTTHHPSAGNYGFKAGTTFTQRFRAAITSVPTELAVRMGSNQNPYRARVEIRVNDAICFSHDFFDLRQRQSDWATVLPILGFPRVVRAGDWVSFSITPDRDTAIAALNLEDPSAPRGALSGYPPIVASFVMRGGAAAQGGSYTPEAVDPTILRSSMGDGSGHSWALHGGATFTQRFKAIGAGIPRELGVRMGANQNPFGCRVTVSIRGAQVFDHTYSGCVQRQSDWAVVFPLEGIAASVQAGDDVAFSVTPDRQIGFEPIYFDEIGVDKWTVPGYGQCRSRFYMKS